MNLSYEKKIGKNLKIGMIFPGQGSQFLGMGKDFYDEERVFQQMFEDANSSLKENFVKLCFSSSEKILQGTIITQTGIFLVSAATYALLNQEYGIVPDLIAGHSLGEYSAVYAAGGLSFFDSLYLLGRRARFMEDVMKDQRGGLLAVMNMDKQVLTSICERYDTPGSLESVVEVAIFNSPTQVVLSGSLEALNLIAEEVEIMRGKAIKLPVSGAFHSRMLFQAEQNYAPYLFKADFHPLKIPVINNILAQKIETPEEVRLSLVRQTAAHIFWWDSMQHFKDCDIIIECGPNDKLSKILRREWNHLPIVSVNSYQDIDNLLSIIKELENKKDLSRFS